MADEKGYGNYGTYGLARRREPVPELRWPQNQITYNAMIKTSAKVAQVVAAMTLPIERATWRVAQNGAPPEIVQHVADDLRLPVHGAGDGVATRRHGGRVSWSEHLQKVLRAPFLGAAFFEQVYAPGTDGREHLVKLAHRHNDTIQKIVVADDGGLEAIVQRPLRDREAPRIGVERLVAYVYKPDDTTWTGNSVLRPMYTPWRAMADLRELEYQIIHRNGMGIPWVQQSELTAPEDRGRERDAALEIATAVQAGEAAGVTTPAGSKFGLVGVSGQLVSPREAISSYKNEIAEAVGANFLNLDGGGGSYALAGTQADFFFQQLQTIADWIADTANQHIVEDLVRVAFPEYEGPCPLITCTPIAAKKDLAPGDIAQLVNAGALLKEPNLEGWLRQNFDIPEARTLAEALQAKKDLAEVEERMGVTLTETPTDTSTDTGTYLGAADGVNLVAMQHLVERSREDARRVLATAVRIVKGELSG